MSPNGTPGDGITICTGYNGIVTETMKFLQDILASNHCGKLTEEIWKDNNNKRKGGGNETQRKVKLSGKPEPEDLKEKKKEIRCRETQVTQMLTFISTRLLLRLSSSSLLVCALCAQSFLSDRDDWQSLWKLAFVQLTRRDFPPRCSLGRKKNLSGVWLQVKVKGGCSLIWRSLIFKQERRHCKMKFYID